jgi:hypothetical protein
MKRISKEDAKKKMAAIAGLISSMDSLDLDQMKGYKDSKKVLEAKKAGELEEEDED